MKIEWIKDALVLAFGSKFEVVGIQKSYLSSNFLKFFREVSCLEKGGIIKFKEVVIA